METEPELRLFAYELRGSAYALIIEAGNGVVDVPGPVPLRLDLGALV